MLGHDYIPVAIFALVALAIPLLTFWLTRFFRPHHDTELKLSTYECGEEPTGEAMIQFHFQYYMFAILFLVFDLVTVFLLLWVVVYTDLTFSAKFTMGIFLAITLLGLWYALRKEEVTWI